MLDRHWLACPEFESGGSLEEHHAESVHGLAADFLGHLAHLCQKASVRNVYYDELRSEEALVRNYAHVLERLHSRACSVYEEIAVRHLPAESLCIGKIEHLCLAVCVLIDLLYCFFSDFIEFVLDVEDGYLGYSVKSCLDLDGCGSAAGSYDGHLLAYRIDIIVLDRCHETDTVRDISGKVAVIVHDRVDSAAQLGCRRQLVEVLAYQCLVRHRYVGSSHLESTYGLYGVLYLISADLEREVRVVSAYFCERFVLHSRRAGVTDRICHEADKFGMSCYSFCHCSVSF